MSVHPGSVKQTYACVAGARIFPPARRACDLGVRLSAMVTSSVPEIQFRDVDRRFQNAFELVEVAVGNLVVCMKKNRRTAHNGNK